jgi:hypothetical protein
MRSQNFKCKVQHCKIPKPPEISKPESKLLRELNGEGKETQVNGIHVKISKYFE